MKWLKGRLWNLAIDDLVLQAGVLAGRNLTRKEWRKSFPDLPYQIPFEQFPGVETNLDPAESKQ